MRVQMGANNDLLSPTNQGHARTTKDEQEYRKCEEHTDSHKLTGLLP